MVHFSNNFYKLNIEGFMDHFISYNSENLFVKVKKDFITLNNYKDCIYENQDNENK